MNQRISTSLAVSLCALLLFVEVGFTQKKNPTVYPYGGVPDKSRGVPDKSRMEDWMNKPPLNFNRVAYFWRATFDSLAYFIEATFDSLAYFSGATFDSLADFNGATFDDAAYFGRATFDNAAYFREATFDDAAYFTQATFDSLAYFIEATFDSLANFNGATFDDAANFSGAKFANVADFVQAHFGRIVILTGTDFRQGVDFRQTYFDSVEIIHLENIIFPEGELRFYWHQFQGKDSLRIRIRNPPADSLKQEHYNRIEIIYHQLRDNFLAQEDKGSADAVIMYELGWQKKKILGEFWWKMYGFFFGWGYQPWRFLLFVVLPVVIIFALVWYFVYYDVLQNAIFKRDISKELGSQQGSKLLKAWHAIFFSFSVLLGVRFKKEWLIKRHNYLFWVTCQWGIGIGLFVTFALLAKGARFGFIRDLLGF